MEPVDSKPFFHYFAVNWDVAAKTAAGFSVSQTTKKWEWVYRKIAEMVKTAEQGKEFSLLDEERTLIRFFVGNNLPDELVEVVAGALGVEKTIVHVYDVLEIVDVYEKEKEYDVKRMARSLMEYMKSEEKGEISRAIIHVLVQKEKIEKNTYTPTEALLLSLMLHTVCHSFPFLTDEQRDAFMRSYVYRSITAGAPLRKSLSNTLYTTDSIVSYIAMNRNLLSSFEKNLERIPLDADGKSGVALSVMWSHFLQLSDVEMGDVEVQRAFGESLYQKEPHAMVPFFQQSLLEILDIFTRIKSANLIEYNEGGEILRSDLYHNQMVQLFTWFGIGKDGAPDIVKYFKQAKHLVPFGSFFEKLKEAADLQDPTTIENIAEVTQALQASGILKKNQEIAEYHEDDGTFHWNESLLA